MKSGGPKRPGGGRPSAGGRAGRTRPGTAAPRGGAAKGAAKGAGERSGAPDRPSRDAGKSFGAGGPSGAGKASRSAKPYGTGAPLSAGRTRRRADESGGEPLRFMPSETSAPRRSRGWTGEAASPRQAEEAQPAPRAPARGEQGSPEAQEVAPAMTGVQTVAVTADEAGMRVDRFLEARFPGLSFSHIQRVVRKGELRVNGKRVETKDRLLEGQAVRIPPLSLEPPKTGPRASKADEETRAFLKSITLYEDDDMLVIDKPMGLAVQGGSGMTTHVDKMLEALTDAKGQTPRLVHRLDRDTSGCLVIAKTRFAASTMAKSFRSRDTRKTYWALVAGVPRVKQGRISTYLAKGEDDEGDAKMHVAKHGAEGATHAVTYYAVVETAAQKLAWLSLKPVTGRTHQLRAHTVHIGHPIVGDPKYFNIENWELPGGIQNRLHLLARRIVIPHPRTGKPIDVTAPLPPHMRQSWNLLGFDTARYDPIEEAPEA
ncbi:RluA family pseudouridine synthase [Alsobacter sp. SYSU BS001988]